MIYLFNFNIDEKMGHVRSHTKCCLSLHFYPNVVNYELSKIVTQVPCLLVYIVAF